ncbi:hypothetical protein BH09MYX1_BH09MYX1_36460 [soil metagenome]
MSIFFALSLFAASTGAAADCARASEAVMLVARGDAVLSSNVDEAIAYYEKASHVQAADAEILWKLALAFKRKADWAHVASVLERACALAPAHAGFFFLRGYALERLERFADARAPLEQAIALDPAYADPEYDLAEVLLHLGDEKGALEHYTKAIQKKPTELASFSALADLYVRLGFLDHAEKTLRAGLAFDAKDGRAFPLHLMLADVLTRKKDPAHAITELEAAQSACGACSDYGQQIVFFSLGAAYALAKVPRKEEAITNLVAFEKMICRGAGASRYPDECGETAELLRRLGAIP